MISPTCPLETHPRALALRDVIDPGQELPLLNVSVVRVGSLVFVHREQARDRGGV